MCVLYTENIDFGLHEQRIALVSFQEVDYIRHIQGPEYAEQFDRKSEDPKSDSRVEESGNKTEITVSESPSTVVYLCRTMGFTMIAHQFITSALQDLESKRLGRQRSCTFQLNNACNAFDHRL